MFWNNSLCKHNSRDKCKATVFGARAAKTSGSITAAQRSEAGGNKPATLPLAGLVLDAHKSERYTGSNDGEAGQLLMSLSPSVMTHKRPDLWTSRMADIATTFISGSNLHHI